MRVGNQKSERADKHTETEAAQLVLVNAWPSREAAISLVGALEDTKPDQ